MNGMRRLLNSIYFLFGLGATSPLLALVVGRRVVSLMTIATLFVFVDLILSKKNRLNLDFRESVLFKQFMGWMIISILACLFGFIFFITFRPDFSYATIGFVPKIFLYILLLYLLGVNYKAKNKITLIIKGIKYGVFLNLIWSIVDAIMYYSIHESLTNKVFHAYIVATDMRLGIASIVNGITIRSVGLNNDPATIGFFAMAACVYGYVVNKKWIILICLLSCAACVSTLGFAGIIMISCYEVFFRMNIKDKVRYGIVIVLLLFSGVSLFSVLEDGVTFDMINAVIERVDSKREGGESSSIRTAFIKKFPEAISNMPTTLILGTGYFTSVYPYYEAGVHWDGGSEGPTSMENTYVDNFFSFGMIGFAIFLLFHYNLFKTYKNKIKTGDNTYVIYSFALSAPIAYLFYHYILYSVLMLIFISSILLYKHNKIHLKNAQDTLYRN